MEQSLQVHRENAVLIVVIDRPDNGNTLNQQACATLDHILRDASADPGVRAVILTGAGQRTFCGGADLSDAAAGQPSRSSESPARVQGDVARAIIPWQHVVTSVLDCEKPVVAAVNGAAAGMGMHLALASDVVVMAESAVFKPSFVRRGIAPDSAGAYLLTRLVGPKVAKRIYMFGDDITARDALALGLVSSVVPSDDCAAQARAFADRLASGPTRSLAITKRLINRALDVDRETALGEEAWGQELAMTTQDAAEGIAAFFERRTSQFRGW